MLSIEDIFRKTVKSLEKQNCEYAVCGGIAALIYRREIRYTGDIDILLRADRKEIATDLISSLGLKAEMFTLAQLSLSPQINKRSSPLAVIVGRSAADSKAFGLDFLTDAFPWASTALARAKFNILSFVDYQAPFITAEDVILAKIPAVDFSARGSKDWDDILSILGSTRNLDLSYLASQFEKLKYCLPKHLEAQLPKALAVINKRARKTRQR